MLMVDELGRAAMAVGPYEPLGDTSCAALIERARQAESEAVQTEVAPETLWAAQDGALIVNVGAGEALSGAASLVSDLAETLGIAVERNPLLIDDYQTSPQDFSEVFFVSDEHGVIAPLGAEGPYARRFADGWQTLLEKASRPGGSAYARRS